MYKIAERSNEFEAEPTSNEQIQEETKQVI